MTPNEGKEKGGRRAERGIKRAAFDHDADIVRDELRLLEKMLANPDAVFTTDDSVDDLGVKFDDGGNWRASIVTPLRNAKIIASCGAKKSCRPSRNAGLTTCWKLLDAAKAERRCTELRAFLQSINDGGSTTSAEPPTDFQI